MSVPVGVFFIALGLVLIAPMIWLSHRLDQEDGAFIWLFPIAYFISLMIAFRLNWLPAGIEFLYYLVLIFLLVVAMLTTLPLSLWLRNPKAVTIVNRIIQINPTKEQMIYSYHSPTQEMSQAEKLEAYQDWQNRDKFLSVGYEEWAIKKFGGPDTDGSPKVKYSTLMGWGRFKQYLDNS